MSPPFSARTTPNHINPTHIRGDLCCSAGWLGYLPKLGRIGYFAQCALCWWADGGYLFKLEGIGYFAQRAYVGWADIGFCREDRWLLQSLGAWGVSDIQAPTCDDFDE